MRRLSHSRLATLDAWLRPRGEPVGRLLFLIPDLWPEADQEVIRAPCTQDDLGDLVERRTGVRPTFDLLLVWSITVPVPEDLLAMSDVEKAAFLEQHETRPEPWWQRREQSCGC